MADFSGLKKLDVRPKGTVPFKIYQIEVEGKTPTLEIAPATEANPQYFNQLLKRTGKSARALRSGSLSAAMLSENREEDRKLYPSLVVKGWSDVIDHSTGQEVPFTPTACGEFLAALPDWIFDEIRDFAATPGNFVERPDVENLAKNSLRGSSGSSDTPEMGSR